MRVFRWIALIGAAAVLLAGCGDGSDQGTTAEGDGEVTQANPKPSQKPRPDEKLQTIILTLEGYADSENVGVLMADRLGYFADVGLNVEIFDPIDSDNVPEYLVQGVDDVGLLPQPQVAISQDKGMPLVAIGSLVPRPTMAMIWPRKSKIEDIADLEGKTIAINGFSFEEGFLEALLARAGLTRDDVKVKSVAYNLVPALVSGRADAILGSGNVEGLELRGRGVNPVVTPLQRLGIPSYEELVVVTRRDRLTRESEWIRPFMSALARGAAAAVADPEAAAEAIASGRGDQEALDPQQSMAKVEATLPLLSRTGRMSLGRASRLVDWMSAQGLIQREIPVPALLTNRFVR